MGTTTGIQWATATWNPWQGCRRVSAGCANCYMYRDKERYGQDGSRVMRSSPATFRMPLSVNRVPPGSLVFVCSWSDFFIEDADAWRDEAWRIMRKRPDVTFMILTKRPENIAQRLPEGWPWPNVWLGGTAENQERADIVLPILLATPAAVHFVSNEPMLGPIDQTQYLHGIEDHGVDLTREPGSKVGGCVGYRPGIDWVICGGESGPKARPMHPDWARGLRDQCSSAGVPFFFKQWGEWEALDKPWDQDNPKRLAMDER